MTPPPGPAAEPITLRRYLLAQVLLAGAPWPHALEAIASTAIEHPEWNLDEVRSWEEWERFV